MIIEIVIIVIITFLYLLPPMNRFFGLKKNRDLSSPAVKNDHFSMLMNFYLKN